MGSPSGTIVMWSGTIIPQGWGLCDGNWYNPQNHNDTGTTRTTNRNIQTPDLRGRFIVGYDSGNPDYNSPGNLSTNSDTKTAGNQGGETRHQLTSAEMPSHAHSISSNSHSHPVSLSGGNHNHAFTRSTLRTVVAGEHGYEGEAPDGIPGPGLTYSSGNDFDNGGNDDGRDYTSSTINNGTINGGAHTHSGNTNASSHSHTAGNTGGNGYHENRPPFYALAYIMKL